MSRIVSYEEWLQHGHYPDGSNPGAKFNPSDPNLRQYYNAYASIFETASEAKRIALNNQHGFGFANSGGEGESGGSSGSGSSGLGPVFTPLDLSAP